jgi:hypothetical protein
VTSAPDEDAISTDVIRIIDDPVLSLELMGLKSLGV